MEQNALRPTIVLAVDGSEHADRAAAFAGQLFSWWGATVDILNVVHEPVETGRAAQAITAYADRVRAQSIVMGRRGLGDIEGFFLGSVSPRVGHLSHRTLITTE